MTRIDADLSFRSAFIKRQPGNLLEATLVLAWPFSLRAGIKKLRVTFKEIYTPGQA